MTGVQFTQESSESPSFLVYHTSNSSTRSENRSVSEFSLEFKTLEESGVLFLRACPWKRDFIGVFLKNGELIYAFNSGSGTAYLHSGRSGLNDGNWHSLTVTR